MSDWQEFEPPGGWDAFADSDALTEALWAKLLPDDWHYLNITSASSIWESRRDASVVRLHYEGERLIEFGVESGDADEATRGIVAQFQLVVPRVD